MKKVKIEDTIIQFKKDENIYIPPNSRKPTMHQKISYIQKDGEWYSCYLDFINKDGQLHVLIRDLILTENRTFKEHIKGPYKEFKISKFKKMLLELSRNTHSLNHFIFGIRKNAYKRRKSIFLFSTVIFLGLGYFFWSKYDSEVSVFMNQNSWIQILSIVLNIISFASLFFPFTFQDQPSEEDAKKMIRSEMEKYDKEKETNEMIRKRATF